MDSCPTPFPCRLCGASHSIPAGRARYRAEVLSRELERGPVEGLSPGEGMMLGVLEAQDQRGAYHFLKAFSGLYEGKRLLPGWAPPLLDPKEFRRITDPQDRCIQELTRRLKSLPADSPRRASLIKERRDLSRRLTRETLALYRLPLAGGREMAMLDLFREKLPPTGTGECCGPKLLGEAHRRGWRPVSLAEFYGGGSTPSGSRRRGIFYDPCPRCRPLMEVMLCPGE